MEQSKNIEKEKEGKLMYELDFSFITQMAERMRSNKHKYEAYAWKNNLQSIEDLSQALFRHVIEVMKGNYEDDGRIFGHLEAIACNVMMINSQLKMRMRLQAFEDDKKKNQLSNTIQTNEFMIY